MSDTRNCSGALKAFCTIIRSTEWKDSKNTRPASSDFLLARLTGEHRIFAHGRKNRFLK